MVEASGTETLHEHRKISRRQILGTTVVMGATALATGVGVRKSIERDSNSAAPGGSTPEKSKSFTVKPASIREQVQSNPKLQEAVATAMHVKHYEFGTIPFNETVPGGQQTNWEGEWKRALDPELIRKVEIKAYQRFMEGVDMGGLARAALPNDETTTTIGDGVWYNSTHKSVLAVGPFSVVEVNITDSMLDRRIDNFVPQPHTDYERSETIQLAEAVVGRPLDN